MGFYGSVYYQLINTFYKVIVKNSGLDTVEFLQDVDDETLLTLEAIGRKGVINLANGNKWINFSKDNNDTIKIWHSAPDNETAKDFFGMKLFTPSEEDFDEDGVYIGNKEYRQLNDHDFIQTYETKKDDAGHLHEITEVMYRLPKAEVNEKVERLEELIGEPTEDHLGRDEEGDNLQTLHQYVEKNYDDINQLETYIGEWAPISSGGNNQPTISDVIGNIGAMFDDDDPNTTNDYDSASKKSLSENIGSLPKLWKEMTDEKTFISIVDAIVKENGKIDSLSNTVEDNYQALLALLGRPIDPAIQVYQHLTDIYDYLDWDDRAENDITVGGEIDNLYDQLDWDNRDSTVNEEITDLNTRLTEIENKNYITSTELNGGYVAKSTFDETVTQLNSLIERVAKLEEDFSSLNAEPLPPEDTETE